MNDRELLELAAKAAGIELVWIEGKNLPRRADNSYVWNPRDDDGDALRLAVRLEMMVDQTGDTSDALLPPCAAAECTHSEPHGEDPYAATRRAILRAAAEVGKTMP